MLKLKELGLAGFWLRYLKSKAKWLRQLLYCRSFRYMCLFHYYIVLRNAESWQSLFSFIGSIRASAHILKYEKI